MDCWRAYRFFDPLLVYEAFKLLFLVYEAISY
jgi:hypothetical protein